MPEGRQAGPGARGGEAPEGRGRRGPVDPRLWREARSVRWWTAGSVALGLGLLGCLVAQAAYLARALTAAMSPHPGRIAPALVGLGVATAIRAALASGAELAASAAAGRAKADLRARALAHLLAGAPASVADERDGELAVALGHGLDRLDVYLGSYLPKMVLAFLAPVVLVVWIGHLDWLSALTLVVTLLLLPIFMVLVGQATRAGVASRWAALARLSAQFLDAVTGLATLRAFGRARAQRAVIGEATDRLRRTTLATLRLAFLSGLVLETLASVGTALVALPLGLRLMAGRMTLAPALAILILTPEVYLPLRRASAEFHASTEGTAAADAVLGLMGHPATGAEPAAGGGGVGEGGDREGGDGGGVGGGGGERPGGADRPPLLRLDTVTVTHPGRARPAVVAATLEVEPGEHVALVGASGAGKSTLAGVAAGVLSPTAGRVLAGGSLLAGGRGLDQAALARWRARVAWLPQRPTIFSGSVADNLRLAAPGATDDELWAALGTAAAAEVVRRLPGGLYAPLAEGGATLSAGERQRLGLARTLLRSAAELVILDEPTAHLDTDREAEVVAGLHRALAGRAALIVTHRQAPLELVDRVVTLEDGRLTDSVTTGPLSPAMVR